MTTVAVTGAQWGDEGKGKIVDILGKDARTFVRYAGGANAGHTLYVEDKKIILHLLPSGIARPDTDNVVGPYVVCDLDVLVEEITLAERYGSRVWLDPRASIVLPIHKEIDRGRERALGHDSVGTTGRGIGPCYEDLTSRRAVRLGDLRSIDRLRARLTTGGYYDERRAVCDRHGGTSQSIDELLEYAQSRSSRVLPHLTDTVGLVARRARDRENIVCEGAQGAMLDLLSGNWPFCTSSICGVAAIEASFGIRPDRVIGVAKAYATRVGSGPFPTELDPEAAEVLRARGGEYGATTKRPRRIGWSDLPALAYACRMGMITELVINKIDVLGASDTVQLCTAYETDAGTVDPLTTLTTEQLAEVRPQYEVYHDWGWDQSLKDCRRREDLPDGVQEFLGDIEWSLGVPITGIGTGPGREDLIWAE